MLRRFFSLYSLFIVRWGGGPERFGIMFLVNFGGRRAEDIQPMLGNFQPVRVCPK